MKSQMDRIKIINLKQLGKTDSEVHQITGYSRTTIHKYWTEYCSSLEKLCDSGMSNDERELTCLITDSPRYDSSGRKKRKLTEEVDNALQKILKDEELKTERLGKDHKQKLTNVQIHALLVEQGFDIGRTTVGNRIKELRDKDKETFIKQEYEYGERFEYDFGEINLWINNQKVKCYAAFICSPASKFRWAYLYTNMRMEVFLDSHVRFFEKVGGSYREGVYDNCRCVVSQFIGRSEKKLNPELIKLSLYYDYAINVTNCFSGNEKGSVESSVKWVRNYIFAQKYEFASFEEADAYMQEKLVEFNKDSKISEEMKCLKPYRPKYESAYINEHFVNKYAFIKFDNNFYSVPDSLSEKWVMVKAYPNYIEIYYKAKKIASHSRLVGKDKTSIDIMHYLHTLNKKPGALKNSAALKQAPELKKIFDLYYTDKPKVFIEILRQNRDMDMEHIIRMVTPTAQMEETQNKVEEKTSEQIVEFMNLFTGGKNVYN